MDEKEFKDIEDGSSNDSKDTQERGAYEYLTVEEIEELDKIEGLPRYEGKGATNYFKESDADKLEYLNTLKIEVPTDWIDSDGEIKKEFRAPFLTMFIVTGHIGVAIAMRRHLLSVDPEHIITDDIPVTEDIDGNQEELVRLVMKELIYDMNNRITAGRLDTKQFRRKVTKELLVEDCYGELGQSANADKRVSLLELHEITQYVLAQLRERKE